MQIIGNTSTPPELLRVSPSQGLTVHSRDDLDDFISDPRGIVWMWEPPLPSATYCMGIDPTGGITGWERTLRTQDDSKVDNGAIQILRAGTPGRPDVQVCEYAAPVDSYELSDIANVLGRLYGGSSDEGQAACIIEVNSIGMATQRRLLETHGYTNMFVWKHLDRATLHYTTALGFWSTTRSVKLLWSLGLHHIEGGKVIINSPFLHEEMTDCVYDPEKMRGGATWGKHDDRVDALLLSLWAIHDWTGQVETVPTTKVETVRQPDWQASDLTAEEVQDAWSDRISDYLDGRIEWPD